MPFPATTAPFPAGTFFPTSGGEVAPTVTTAAASGATKTSAILNGTVAPNGLATHYYFEWGTSITYSGTTAETNIGSGTVGLHVDDPVFGLHHSRTYHYRIVAWNGAGTSYGDDVSFDSYTPDQRTVMYVSEKPPLRQYVILETPTGQVHRWGEDETVPERSFSALSYGDGQPGGYEQMTCSLPRKQNLDYADLEPFSNVQVRSAGGDITWEGRLERAPKVAGNEFHIDPDAVGWQAHLEDNKNCAQIFQDIAFDHWGAPSAEWQLNEIKQDWSVHTGGPMPSKTTGNPSLGVGGEWGVQQDAAGTVVIQDRAANMYDAGPVNIDYVDYRWVRGTAVPTGGGDVMEWNLYSGPEDTFSIGDRDSTGDLVAAGPGQGQFNCTGTNHFLLAQLISPASHLCAPQSYYIYWTRLQVVGDHGLTKQGSGNSAGFYASDIIEWIVDTSGWCPELEVGTIDATTFQIGQLEFRTPTTPAEMIKQTNRFHLFDWFIGPGKKFHYRQRGTYGRTWLARVGPARLEEQGLAADRCITHVLVSYQDVDGTPMYVGPVGSGADTEDASLEDTDTDNPAVAAGIERWATLSMDTSTSGGAVQVGSRFLDEFKLVNHSGRAELVGWVMDDKGVNHPYSSVTAGDSIVFLDAADSSPRRIVKTSKNHATKAVAVDLDAPPEGTQALLERLGVGLVNLGAVGAPAVKPPLRDPTQYYPASSFPGPPATGIPI